jgi:ketosteroid isomerase-like protein
VTEAADIETVRTFYAAFADGKLDQISDLLAEKVVFHVPGRGSLASDYHGTEEVATYLAKVSEAGAVVLRPSMYLSGDDHIAVVLDVEGQRGDRCLNERGMQLFRLTGGKIAERWSYPPESYACDEYFA